MKKTFQLQVEGKNRDRLLDAIKHEVRKYVKRERRRALPVGVDYWDFDCRFGVAEDNAEVLHLGALIAAMDAVAQAGGAQFYVEILAKHGVRQARPEGAAPRVTSSAAAAAAFAPVPDYDDGDDF